MTTDKNLNFISNGIKNLGTAIFSDFSTSILKFPTCVITISNIDKSGNIWFHIKKPYEDISGFDKEFSAQLQFYNKNYNYHITAHGNATIILKENELATDQSAGNETLIRLRIFNAEYCYSRKNGKTDSGNYINKLITWLFIDEKNDHSLNVHFNL